ncbi:MAG TPA: DUF1343 domain-containing protein [Novosphingobium sp.]|nr:DUF1343 domain-containing protein [Novosphingobium sp.]
MDLRLSRRRFGLGAAAAAALPGAAFAAKAEPFQTGLDRLVAGEGWLARGKSVALLTHAGAVDAKGRRAADAIAAMAEPDLVALLAPEHGLAGQLPAGADVPDGRDPATGLPVYSLYGRTTLPTELLARIDTILIDLQDVGVRPFTYAWTMRTALRIAAEHGKRALVLDRPNPLGGRKVDGPMVDPALASPVGATPVPFRHGLTMGEMAGLIQADENLMVDLSVMPMKGWTRDRGIGVYGRGGLPFVAPSPNLRSPGAILAYAAAVLVEGTNLSEGRGTPRPFETIGAPWCDGKALARTLTDLDLPGVRFKPVTFTPTTSKHSGQPCAGVRFEVRDEAAYDPLLTGLSLIAAARARHPDRFAFLPGERPFFDLLTGQAWVRQALLDGDSPAAIVRRWQTRLPAFRRLTRAFALYD